MANILRTTHKTERTGVAVVMHWMREIIARCNLDLGLPDVETSGTDRKMPDLVIYESRRSQQILCLIEAKPPHFDVLDEEGLKEPARKKATQRGAKYFALLNFKRLVWFKTERANQALDEEQQIVDKYSLSEIRSLNELEQTRFAEPIKRRLEEFLVKLYNVHSGREAEPRIAIDELLILRLQEKISLLAYYYRHIIEEQAQRDKKFTHRLTKWFAEQNWSFAGLDEDYDKAARQTAYLLVNKILFYDLVQAKRPGELDPLEIPVSLTKGAMLQTTLQGYFSQVLKIDYENIFSTDFVDELAFPEAREVVEEIKKLVTILNRYDFSTLGFDIIGRIFERLIPQTERHNLGQYFTSADVVDLILKFCLTHEQDVTLDPSCGAGTFLVRAYQHKKLMNQRRTHAEILDTLWGNDSAKFPASLAIINLAINDLAVDENYPNVIQEDFFALQVGSKGLDLEEWRTRLAQTLRGKERAIVYPRYFDAIVGNPPYTRQEEISEIAPDVAEYKEKLIANALKFNNQKFADISKRAGIHAYFFVHGTKFLKEGGRFGFIVSNAWLDTEYGRGLQEFLLQHYKLVAIIESKIERWFEEADVNTCIVILEKSADAQARAENIVRFVYLKKPLRHFIPAAQDLWEKQLARLQAIEDLRRTILFHSDIYENDELRIYPRQQKQLWAEGFNAEEGKYAGAKWGKYLRAPEIFFKILEKGKDKLIPLKEVATTRFGIKTGANEFFYLTQAEAHRLGIEEKFLQPIIFSLKEVKGYRLDKKELANRAIICHQTKQELKGTKLLKYIKSGEERGFNLRPTCASRGADSWYMLAKDWDYAPLVFPAKVGERMPVFLNDGIFEDKKLYGIEPHKEADAVLLAALLNSTLARLFIEFSARQLTGAQAIADIDVIVVETLNIIDPKKISAKLETRLQKSFERLANTPAESLFKEIAPTPDAVSLDGVKAERRELDKIIMGDILGLSETEQLEVYVAVVDIVRARLDKAKSVGKRAKRKGGSLVDALSQNLLDDFRNGD